MKRLVLIVAFLTVFIGSASSAMAGQLEEQLWGAVKFGTVDDMRVLLDKGADVNAKNGIGETALLQAAYIGKTDMMNVLLDRGADINAKDNFSYTALMRAVRAGKIDIMDVLLDRGADTNAKDDFGFTVLMKAAYIGKTDILIALLDKGADINAETRGGRTALMVAEANGKTNIIQMLKKAEGSQPVSPTDVAEVPASGETAKLNGFLGIPWGSSREEVRHAMEKDGFSFYKEESGRDIKHQIYENGSYARYNVYLANALFKSNAMYCGSVMIKDRSGMGRELNSIYNNLKKLLQDKYGAPQEEIQKQEPNFGNGVTVTETIWKIPNGEKIPHTITLSKTPAFYNSGDDRQFGNFVEVSYMNEALEKELDEREKEKI